MQRGPVGAFQEDAASNLNPERLLDAGNLVGSFGILPSLSFSEGVGSPLVRYASMPAARCSNVGVGASDAALTASSQKRLRTEKRKVYRFWAKSDPVKAPCQRRVASPPH